MKRKGLSYVNEIKYAKIYFRNKHAIYERESIINTIHPTKGTIKMAL